MASEKRLKQKENVVEEIKSKLDNSKTFLLLDYQGLTVSALSELRNKLKETESEVKVYKNTLMSRALEDKKISLSEYMSGPNAYLFSKNILEPIKTVSEFAKTHPELEIRIGVVDGDVISLNTIKEYASIPSYEGLLTMFAGGLMEHVRNFSIALNLYANNLENKGGEN